jgi:hypothetical protein
MQATIIYKSGPAEYDLSQQNGIMGGARSLLPFHLEEELLQGPVFRFATVQRNR